MSARKVTPTRRWSAPQWLMSLVFILLVAGPTLWMVKAVRLAKVPSESMEPTLVPGDVLAVRIDAYRDKPPRRGDVIIFEDQQEGGWLVKRVIGQPGEHVGVFSGRVWVNSQPLVEPYAQGGRVFEVPQQVQLSREELFVMGDNRDHAKDSRDFGPVRLEQVVGRVTGIIWPWARRQILPRLTDSVPQVAQRPARVAL